ncbi:S1C family serine protease [Puia sp.]|jgi:S1-C subfamily serine protease|uniref:S1C family serine protease n=1 Tax=Puia sp. TaxID=2045100 RepID=UPI002F402533
MKYLIALVVSFTVMLGLLLSRRHPGSYARTETPLYQTLYAGYDLSAGSEGPADFTDMAQAAVAATVQVTAKISDEWGESGLSMGSGAILSGDGIIVTNQHVVKGAEGVTVTLNNHRAYKARLIGADAATDLAVLKIDAHELTAFSYGNSGDLKVGNWVVAIGYPFGLGATVTAGIVSAKRESLIQTDAAVNHGNSGGPLVDGTGRLIGINAALATSTGAYVGYSYAIPSVTVKRVVNMILGGGSPKVTH